MKKKCDHLIGIVAEMDGVIIRVLMSFGEQYCKRFTDGSNLFKYCPLCGSKITLPWEKGRKI
jgi:hypothetical protein